MILTQRKLLLSLIGKFCISMVFFGLLRCSTPPKSNKTTPPIKEIYSLEIQKKHQKTFRFYVRADTSFIPNRNGNKNITEGSLECSKQKVTLQQVKIRSESEDIPPLPMLFFAPATDGELDENSCRSIIFARNGEKFQFPFKIQQVEGNLFAYPYMFEISDSLVLFGIDVVRITTPNDEYFPTSERLRVEIQNMLGKTIWRSDEDAYFLQVIGEVEPKEIGSCYRYVKLWNRQNNAERFVEKGKFRAILTLPIHPKPITKYLEINFGE